MQLTRKIPLAIERYLLDAAIMLLLFSLYAPLIWHWYDGWLKKSISIEHEYFSHGLIGLPFAAYLCWLNRPKWRKLANTAHPLGAGLLALGAVFYLTGLADFVNLSLPIVLAGLCLWLKGTAGLRLQGFPLLLILLASPNDIPYLLTPYTLPLQSFIAGVAGFILTQFGMDVTVEQIYLLVGGKVVEVAPYCAGLKMLFTSLYVSLMLLYWTGTLASRSKTIGFLITAVGISVTANIIRNTFLTWFHGTGQDAAFHWLHDGWGGDVYSAGMLGLLVVLINLIEKYFPTAVPPNPEI